MNEQCCLFISKSETQLVNLVEQGDPFPAANGLRVLFPLK